MLWWWEKLPAQCTSTRERACIGARDRMPLGLLPRDCSCAQATLRLNWRTCGFPPPPLKKCAKTTRDPACSVPGRDQPPAETAQQPGPSLSIPPVLRPRLAAKPKPRLAIHSRCRCPLCARLAGSFTHGRLSLSIFPSLTPPRLLTTQCSAFPQSPRAREDFAKLGGVTGILWRFVFRSALDSN